MSCAEGARALFAPGMSTAGLSRWRSVMTAFMAEWLSSLCRKTGFPFSLFNECPNRPPHQRALAPIKAEPLGVASGLARSGNRRHRLIGQPGSLGGDRGHRRIDYEGATATVTVLTDNRRRPIHR